MAQVAVGFELVARKTGKAGWEYPAVALGEVDIVAYRRILRWDHVAGALLVNEVGGVAARFDGTPYTARRISTCWWLVHRRRGGKR